MLARVKYKQKSDNKKNLSTFFFLCQPLLYNNDLFGYDV